MVDVQYAGVESLDLQPHPQLESRLHHPYQSFRQLPGAKRMEIRTLSFSSPEFSKINEVQIPSMDLIVHDAYIEFDMPAIVDLTAQDLNYNPTPTWIDYSGVDLRYKSSSIYNMSEAEALMAAFEDRRPQDWQSRQLAMGFHNAAVSGAGDLPTRLLYLPLKPLVDKILSKVGPLSAYPSNDFSISVPLRAALQSLIYSTGTPTETNPTTMKLILIGTKAPPEEVLRTKMALDSGGIVLHYLRSQNVRKALENSTSQQSFSYPEILGTLGAVRILSRGSSNWNTVGSSNVTYTTNETPDDSIAIGKTSFPQEIFGQSQKIRLIKSMFPCQSLDNASSYVSSAATTSYTDTGIINVNFYESPGDMEFGTSTGSYPVKNDFNLQLTYAGGAPTASHLDVVFYIHVQAVINTGSWVVNLSS